MIHTDEYRDFLKSPAFLEPLGIAPGTGLDFQTLGQGEYNCNFSFEHPDGRRLVLRINRGSQMHLQDQIGYEFKALKALEASRRTPGALACYSEKSALVMEHLPGRPLQYETDLEIAAGIFADIHALPPAPGLIEPENPLETIVDECRRMAARYYEWGQADPEVVRLLKTLEAEISARDLTAPVGVHRCMVNTEVNSGNFLINPGGRSYLIDWEKPLISEPAQDLGHFLVPTTTFWKTDVILKPEDIRHFVRCYEKAVAGRFETESLQARLPLYFTVTCLRGVTWCAMACREYSEPGRAIANADTFRKIQEYLKPDFLENILQNYVRKDFLA